MSAALSDLANEFSTNLHKGPPTDEFIIAFVHAASINCTIAHTIKREIVRSQNYSAPARTYKLNYITVNIPGDRTPDYISMLFEAHNPRAVWFCMYENFDQAKIVDIAHLYKGAEFARWMDLLTSSESSAGTCPACGGRRRRSLSPPRTICDTYRRLRLSPPKVNLNFLVLKCTIRWRMYSAS
jgi:hypothetical protein